ncbi:YHS domain-containing protein [sulfur-oxidizing endosymbiont of Gigantopelta aegis]|uniref:YHS domain-containing protein n=1 Tax=sulfur-oxidizing endosymbiont of Gigantopelta aegis TaxID=2794934 RepID=UPI0018DD56DD|nr:YHS domain-containing protein [sulfur-oxidizing endosymbiont of Gigantopelta aegis]
MSNENEDIGLSDPVCGMSVTKDSEHHEHLNHSDYYFCSSNCHDKFNSNPEEYISPEEAAQAQLSDPVCGMNVTKDSEHHEHYKHDDYYFCSSSCHDKFTSDPEQYAQEKSTEHSSNHHHSHSPSTDKVSEDYCPDGKCDIGATFYDVSTLFRTVF